MPRPGPRRLHTCLRFSQQELDRIDELALAEGLVKGDGSANRSEMVRRLVREAMKARTRRR